MYVGSIKMLRYKSPMLYVKNLLSCEKVLLMVNFLGQYVINVDCHIRSEYGELL